MTKAKFDPPVYQALKSQGMSNRQIAAALNVNEASVRRGLAKPVDTPKKDTVRRRVTVFVIEDTVEA